MYELHFMLTKQKDDTVQSTVCLTALNFTHKYRSQKANIR